MGKLQTLLDFTVDDIEDCAYDIAKYFVSIGCASSVEKSSDGYIVSITKEGLLRGFLGSTVLLKAEISSFEDCTHIAIWEEIKDGVVKEIFTYVTVLGGVKKIIDKNSLMKKLKIKVLKACEKHRVIPLPNKKEK